MAGDLVGPGDLLARRYRLVARTGGGGMSAVWRAVDERLSRQVAVKLPAPQLSTDHADRLRKEARACARIDHPGAVEVFDFGEAITAHGRIVPFTVMPLLSGEPLAARLESGPLPWQEAVAVAARVASVLAAAHEQGVVHQDVSAENVHLTPHGPKLLDFGLATAAGEPDLVARSRGTPPYVAPERLAGAAPDPASDVYALGVLLFESLTGRRPYPETTWEELDARQWADPAPRPLDVPGLPAAVVALCQGCLSVNPQDRPSAAAVAAALATVTAPGPRWSRRALVTAGLVPVLLVAGLSVAAQLVASGKPAGPVVTAPQSPGTSTDGAGRPPGRVEAPAPMPPAPDRSAPVTGPAEAAPELSLIEALDRFQDTLRQARETGAIRTDVSVDLGQLAEQMVWAVDPAGQPGQADVPGMVDELRRKLDDRLREGAVSREAWDGLQDDLSLVAAAACPGRPRCAGG